METIISLLIISGLICFITNISGFIDYFEDLIKNKILYKLFTCSLCQIWWVGLGYLVLSDNLTLVFIGVVALLSFLNQEITAILVLIQDLISRIIYNLTNLIKKIKV